mgnify:FL=1
MGIKFANNASTVVTVQINSSATTVSTGNNQDFPALESGEFFYATVLSQYGTVGEILKVTGITKDSSAGSFTVERGQDDTSSNNIFVGDRIELRVTSAGLAGIAEESEKRVIANTPYKSAEDLAAGWVTVAELYGPSQKYNLEYVITARNGANNTHLKVGLSRKAEHKSGYVLGVNQAGSAVLTKVRILQDTGIQGGLTGDDYGSVLLQVYNDIADSDVYATCISVGGNHPDYYFVGSRSVNSTGAFAASSLVTTPTTTTPAATFDGYETFWEVSIEDTQLALTGDAVLSGKMQASEVVVRGEDADASPAIKFLQDATETASITYNDNNTVTDDLEIKSSGGIKFLVNGTNNAFSIDDQGSVSFGTTGLASESYVDTEIAGLIGSNSNFVLDTLKKLNDALNNDASFYTNMLSIINVKYPKTGGQLTGDVTIATSTPKLTLKDTSVADDHEILFTDNANSTIYSIDTSSNFLNFDKTSGKGFKFKTNGSSSFDIDTAGDAKFYNDLTVSGDATLCNSTSNSVVNICTGSIGGFTTKTVNIGTGADNGGYTTINIGPTSTSTARAIRLNGAAEFKDTAEFTKRVDFKSDASGANIYDQMISFVAKTSSTGTSEAARIATVGNAYAPSRIIIGQARAGLSFFDYYSGAYIYPQHASTGATQNNVVSFGQSWARWKLGYFASGTTTSSDINEKRDIEELTEAELRVATRCKPLLRKYRRIEAIEEKGEGARIHFGIIAQDLEDAFSAEGLDAHRYAMFMKDTWYETEEGGTAHPSLDDLPEELRDIAVEKTRLGVRYEQLLAFIIAAM